MHSSYISISSRDSLSPLYFKASNSALCSEICFSHITFAFSKPRFSIALISSSLFFIPALSKYPYLLISLPAMKPTPIPIAPGTPPANLPILLPATPITPLPIVLDRPLPIPPIALVPIPLIILASLFFELYCSISSSNFIS